MIFLKDIEKQLKKSKEGSQKQKGTSKYETAYDRMSRANDVNSSINKDRFKVTDEYFWINLEPIVLLSNNDLQRINERSKAGYKKILRDRIVKLLSQADMDQWKERTNDKKIIAESILTMNRNIPMDFDNLVGAFKHVIDGYVDAGILRDDSPKYMPYHLPEQIKIYGAEHLKAMTLFQFIDDADSLKTENYIKMKNKLKNGW